eukprot:8027371-Pyramimonas_sp.AAC.1
MIRLGRPHSPRLLKRKGTPRLGLLHQLAVLLGAALCDLGQPVLRAPARFPPVKLSPASGQQDLLYVHRRDLVVVIAVGRG